MTVTMTARERDALYGEIALRLGRMDATYWVLQTEDYEKAQELAREYADYLIFIRPWLGSQRMVPILS
jgi:hypothetical protein